MTSARGRALLLWIAAVAACGIVITHTRISTDMSAFLPRSPSAAQQVLVDQVRNGVVSRLILVGIEGAPPEALARLSHDVAERLRGDAAFASVSNGEASAFDRDREFLWRHRYLLSPGVVSERFTAAGLHEALQRDLQLLGSNLSPVVKRSLPSDPTSEIFRLIDQLAGAGQPHSRDGVWFSPDESRALLLVETRAAGFDIDAQQQALQHIDTTFDQARRSVAGAEKARLLETGPGVFAVRTRTTMEEDATRFSLLATILVGGLLLFAYRSLRVLILGFLPVVSGALAGIAAVSLGFGFVHGITLGFGVTLIGESVDYAIYLFTQTAPGSSPESTLARIWPTLRLGVLTSVAGFSAMLFSSFAGFAQLGLFSITGLMIAVGVTRWILPVLLPRHFATVDANIFAPPLLAVIFRARQLYLPLLLLILAAIALLCLHRGGFWQTELSSLSPIPSADQALDRQLRSDIGAPDVRYLLAVTAADEQQALGASERLSRALDALVARHDLAGFDAPDRYLPSAAAQRARQAALPDEATLRARLQEAAAGLPFRSELFAPFLADVAAAARAPLLMRSELPPGLSLKLDALLFAQHGQWTAVLPLRGVVDPQRLAADIATLNEPGTALVDLKSESDRLLQTYQNEAVTLALVGSLIILVLLAASLRSLRRVLVVVSPLAAAVILTTALLTVGGGKLSIFNVVGLLLIVAIGSNYCLFFERQNREDEHRERAVASLLLANLCTVIGFGVLSFSRIPVLHDIGSTAAIGALLSLLSAAVFSTRSQAEQPRRLDEIGRTRAS
jgi:predicted exporter